MEALSSVVGTNIPLWLYRLLAIFPLSGMIALDHFALGSKYSAFAKSLLNVVTFGSWYVFDALQSLDGKRVTQKGISIPFYGQTEIGKGKIVEGFGVGGAQNILNILFTLTAAALFFISYFFKDAPGFLGKLSTVAMGISLPATIGIGGFSIKSAFKPPDLSGVPSLGQVAKLVGGGQAEEEVASYGMSMDGAAIGLLLTLAASGFTLAYARQASPPS